MARRTLTTPGPWSLRRSTSGNHFIFSDHRAPAVAGVANTAKGIDDAEALANAQLIAAAPELRELLQRLYDWVENNVAYGAPARLGREIDDALAKAEGRT